MLSFLKHLFKTNKKEIDFDIEKFNELSNQSQSFIREIIKEQNIEKSLDYLKYPYRMIFLGRTDKLNEETWNSLVEISNLCNPNDDVQLSNYKEARYNEIPSHENMEENWNNIHSFIFDCFAFNSTKRLL